MGKVDKSTDISDEKISLWDRFCEFCILQRLRIMATASYDPHVIAYTHSKEAWDNIKRCEREAKEQLQILEARRRARRNLQ